MNQNTYQVISYTHALPICLPRDQKKIEWDAVVQDSIEYPSTSPGTKICLKKKHLSLSIKDFDVGARVLRVFRQISGQSNKIMRSRNVAIPGGQWTDL